MLSDEEERAQTARIMTNAMKEGMHGPTAECLRPEEILRIASEMQSCPGDSRARAVRFSKKYPAFMEQCPVLFQKACRPGMDMNMLRFMVSTIRESEDDAESSGIVGKRLAERFVRPSMVAEGEGEGEGEGV
eukprot:jgi/Tetstr1/454105/TSEL_041024.t1